ncbi:MAG: hypothetical protein ACD_7C00123G0002 [uncultured bacterium]|nr:MAG: hypothetical protein ACD_7C00123G0002 [uncultured bacterium]HBR79585.1 hypothetical protein [Candidatus Moranbacteria bacterium]
MDEKIENNNKKKSKKKRILLLVILALFLIIAGLFFWNKNRQQTNNPSDNENLSLEGDLENGEPEDEISENAKDNGENVDKATVFEDTKEMVSENYRVSQINFGVGVPIERGLPRDVTLEIFQVKSEMIISQEDNEPRILITWKTNKEAISNIEYAKSDGKNAVVITEEGYGFEHSMLVKNMEFSTIYTYRIESADKWGNKASTEYFSAYTGDKSESIFDLITNAVEDVFGWAM